MTTPSSQIPGPKLDESWVVIDPPPPEKSPEVSKSCDDLSKCIKVEDYYLIEDYRENPKMIWPLLKNAEKAILEHKKEEDDGYAILEEGMPNLRECNLESYNYFERKRRALEFAHSIAKDHGKRPYMEDFSLVSRDTINNVLVAAVYDGHCGSLAAQKMCNRTAYFKYNRKNPRQSFENFFNESHNWFAKYPTFEISGSGTTAVMCSIDTKTNLIFTATIADSEAVICRRVNGKWILIPLSCVRTWKSPKDMARLIHARKEFFREGDEEKLKTLPLEMIRSEYPYQVFTRSGLVCRGFSLSRALGDLKFRGTEEKPLVIHKPKITVNVVKPGDIILLASDGLWDFLKPKELIQLLNKYRFNMGVEGLGQYIIDSMKKRGKIDDNITIVAIQAFAKSFQTSKKWGEKFV